MASLMQFLFLSVLVWSRTLLPGVGAESIQCDASLFSASAGSNGSSTYTKPRVFILSDILNEPDDSMSMVRLLVYSNQLDIRGLCATTSTFLGNVTHPEEMERIIRAYGEVVDNLNRHVSSDYQFGSAEKYLSLVTSGPNVYGMAALNSSLSEGAQRLIESLEESTDPLYVSIWGGANTLAQALQHIENEKSPEEAALLRSRLRAYAISDQDETGTWIQARWPDIFYISSIHGFTEFPSSTWVGITSDDNGFANITKVRDPWITPNIRVGPLGSVYPLIEYGMEGDTPSFLWLVENGLSSPGNPDRGGWGGRYTRVVKDMEDFNWYGNSADTVALPGGGQYLSIAATIWRWRDAYQDDFAARMQWTLNQSVSEVAHPPLVVVNGSAGPEVVHVELRANESVVLDAGKTCDADHPGDTDQLDFEWFLYPAGSSLSPYVQLVAIQPLAPPSGTNGILELNEAGFANVTLGTKVEVTRSVQLDALADGAESHVILQVRTRKGPHVIRRYKRIIIKNIQ